MTAVCITQVIILGNDIFKEKHRRNGEYFNELMLLMTMYTFLCYSPWVDDIITKFYIGYMTIFIVCLHFVINILLIAKNSIINAKNKCVMYFKKHQLKKER